MLAAAAAAVVTQADAVIAAIATQRAQLAAVLGLNLAADASAAEKAERKKMEKTKELLIRSHLSKAMTLAYLLDIASKGEEIFAADATPLDSLKATWRELQRWYVISTTATFRANPSHCLTCAPEHIHRHDVFSHLMQVRRVQGFKVPNALAAHAYAGGEDCERVARRGSAHQ